MIKNYIKTAFRNLIRHKTFSIVNVIGLSLGLTIGMFNLLWVVDEMSFDKFHSKYKNTYRMIHESFSVGESMHFSNCPAPLGNILKERFPEVETMFRFTSFGAGKLVYKEKTFMLRHFYYADKEILDVLDFDFIYGDAKTALSEPSSIIISQSTSQKLFGDVNPIGKTIQSDDVDNFKIAGVFKDFPLNSSLMFDLIVPFTYLKEIGFSTEDWGSFSWQTFLYLKSDKAINSLKEKMKGLLAEFVDGEEYVLKLQSLEDLHFYNMDGSEGRIKYVRIFIIIGIVIILLACINFMNLSTVRAIKRSREIGIRKSIGANRMQLIRLVLSETFIMVCIAMLISMSMVELFRPFFNELTGKGISITYFNAEFLFILILILITTTLLSGFYPAFILSSMNPLHALKGVKDSGKGKARIRIALVVLQFAITIILISGSITVYKQLTFMNERDLGMATDNIVYVEMDETLKEKFESFRHELAANPNIEAVTKTYQMPSYNKLSTNISWDEMEEGFSLVLNISVVDPEYIKTFGLKIIEGRDFVKGSSSDSAGVIINEEAVKQLKLKNPVGTNVSLWGDGKILGVVKNYNFMPLTMKIQPIALKIRNDGLYRYAVIRIKPDEIQSSLGFIEEKVANYSSNQPFDYHFMNEDYDQMYRFETRLSIILKYFTILAISIALLGLYGLSAFISEQRTKEVGVRKVLGASVQALLTSFVIDFCKWVVLAAVIAIPISWYIMQNWLDGFAYRIQLSLGVFIISGLFATIIAATTVAFQAYRSTLKNPVDALRHE